ncbi:hypothetical protein RA955_07780 [Geobacillus proteiniphilus]|uniref:Mobile element protein n=1 Tax=Geobacillus proteiniphilus TaxID=860353 RepID=A0ABY9MIP0_9BACL|nr:hypothetical protein [Geobacillus proteiniphilus]WMJ17907.1 hypothetical protein RA955_07780 [Geobacillus proteiniphilus]
MAEAKKEKGSKRNTVGEQHFLLNHQPLNEKYVVSIHPTPFLTFILQLFALLEYPLMVSILP